MLDNRHRRLIRCARPGRLNALLGVAERLLGCPLANLHTLVADIDASVVHHGEHGCETAVFRPDQLPDALAIVAIAHNAGGRGVYAQLVLEADAAKIVTRPQRSVGLHMILGNDEERDPPTAFWGVGKTREDEVDDILRQFVLAPRDIDFLALDEELARMLALGDRGCRTAQRANVGTRLRFGKVHRT